MAAATVRNWRDRFLAAGRQGLEYRLRAENEQLKLALAEATVQLRLWRASTRYAEAGNGAAGTERVPSTTSRP